MRLLVLSLVALATGASAEGPRDDFERGLCVSPCRGAAWAITQEQNGRVQVARAPERRGLALLAEAGPKQRGAVSKADLVARTRFLPAGTVLTIAFDLNIPAGAPLDSLQLVDVECASCGEGGNPGVRLYLRRGRLRIDRSKIAIRHAWARDDATQLVAGRWHHIVWQLRLGGEEAGAARVLLDGREVLRASGATVAPLARRGADRVQIGITANSNAMPARAWFDDVSVTIGR